MRVPLVGGAYQSKGLLGGAQSCINLYPEQNPEDAPYPYTYYPTPGLEGLTAADQSSCRGRHFATNGDLYMVYGSKLYYVTPAISFVEIGYVGSATTPVSMSDNGLVLVIVDGSPQGWCVELSSKTFGTISSTKFYGGSFVAYIDTYFAFSRADTNQWYISLSNVDFTMLTTGTAFNALDIVAKSGYPDKLQSLVTLHREIWLIGEVTTEIWSNTGAADFTFGILPGVFIQHGTCAKYSTATQDLSVYWLSQDPQGNRMVLKGANYAASRISNHAMEQEIATYSRVDDAIGDTYQQDGHTFYVLTFPTADVTWCYDEATEAWHKRAWADNDGNLHRHRVSFYVNAYGMNLGGDWQNGNLYKLNTELYTELGLPVPRIRSFAHMVKEARRMFYTQFIAWMQVGTDTDPNDLPIVSLRYSDDAGMTWSNPLQQSLGKTGEYITSLQWQRLGMARDRVFEISWSSPVKTCLCGAFIQVTSANT